MSRVCFLQNHGSWTVSSVLKTTNIIRIYIYLYIYIHICHFAMLLVVTTFTIIGRRLTLTILQKHLSFFGSNLWKVYPSFIPLVLLLLVGGWTNPFEKICSSTWIISPRFGVKINKYGYIKLHHPRKVTRPNPPWLPQDLCKRAQTDLNHRLCATSGKGPTDGIVGSNGMEVLQHLKKTSTS